MFIKRTKEGEFINERYEKWNRIAGVFAIIQILAIFLCAGYVVHGGWVFPQRPVHASIS